MEDLISVIEEQCNVQFLRLIRESGLNSSDPNYKKFLSCFRVAFGDGTLFGLGLAKQRFKENPHYFDD